LRSIPKIGPFETDTIFLHMQYTPMLVKMSKI